MNIILRGLIASTHYPSLGVVWLRTTLGFGHWYDWIDDSVALGARPRRHHLEQLSAAGVRTVINLCAEYRGHPQTLARLGMTQLWLPTIDYTAPAEDDVRRGLDRIRDDAAHGAKVYVHCKAGNGRAATLALCWLMQRHALPALEAQARLLAVRPGVMRRLHERPVVRAITSSLST